MATMDNSQILKNMNTAAESGTPKAQSAELVRSTPNAMSANQSIANGTMSSATNVKPGATKPGLGTLQPTGEVVARTPVEAKGFISSATTPSAASYGQYTQDAINGIYDAQRAQRLAELESAYNQNLSTAEAARDKIGGAYQEQQNNLATTYERTRRNSNEMAAANGINTGAGTQAQLMQRSEYQRDSANIGKAEANAMNDAERGIADLKTNYQNAIAKANADNDYARSTALLQQYKDEYNKQAEQAKTLAAYGDFSGYAALFGQEQADNMKKAWVASNPDLAYNTGAVSADEYRAITGTYPRGYVPAYGGGGGGNGWYDSYTRNPTPDNNRTVTVGNLVYNTDGSYNSAQTTQLVNELMNSSAFNTYHG